MINKRKKNKIDDNSSTLDLWERYDSFVRSLHLQKIQKSLSKPTSKQIIFNYFKKIFIVFLGSAVTTFAFYFFIDANKLYNGGMNGLIQVFTSFLIGNSNISWDLRFYIYYGLSFLVNCIIVFVLYKFYNSDISIISTSIPYVLFQMFWTRVFEQCNFFFTRFSHASWKGSGESPLSLPFLIVIALAAALINAVGYNFIMRAQATTGGFDTIEAHFSTKKTKLKIGLIKKLSAFIIILLIIILNLFFANSGKMKKRYLERDLLKTLKQTNIKPQSLDIIIRNWEIQMDQANKLRDRDQDNLNSKSVMSAMDAMEIIRNKKENKIITDFLNSIIGRNDLADNPKEYLFYIMNDEEREKEFEKEIKRIDADLIKHINKETSFGALDKRKVDAERLQKEVYWQKRFQELQERKRDIIERQQKLIQQKEEKIWKRLLYELTNDERMWASFIFILASSYLLAKMFPRSKMVTLRLYCKNIEDRDQGLQLLEAFSPVYAVIYRKKDNAEDEASYLVTCKISKWNHYLLIPYLKQIGEFYEN